MPSEWPRKIARRLYGLQGRELEEALERVAPELRPWVRYYVTKYAHELERRRLAQLKALERRTWEERVDALKRYKLDI